MPIAMRVPVATSSRLPPRVAGWPIVGKLPELIFRQFDFWLAAQKQYGDVYTLDLGVTEVLVLGHPRHAEHVFLRQANNYPDKGGPRGFRASITPAIRNGLATIDEENDLWRQQRRLIQPYFRSSNLAPLAAAMSSVIADELDGWRDAAAAGRPVDVTPALARITVNSVLQTILGVPPQPAHFVDRYAAALRTVLDRVFWGMLETALPAWLPLPGGERQRRAGETMSELARQVIVKRQSLRKTGDDLLASMLRMTDDAASLRLTNEQVLEEVISLMSAGIETMMVGVGWAIYLLAAHPDKLTLLRAEIEDVIGKRPPTATDLGKLPYARMVLKESLRLASPIYQVQRRAKEDDEIDGYRIPAGTVVSTLLYGIHHHPDVWEDAFRFLPERFAEESAASRHRFAWLPFGAGRRVCVAQDYSILLGQLILAQVLQRYRVRPVPRRTPRLFLSTGTRPRRGVFVQLEPL